MKQHNLYKSPVVFREDDALGIHSYTLDGVELSGITSLLRRQEIMPSYDGVDEEVLRNAAQHGKIVHEAIQNLEEFGIESFIPDVEAYKKQRPSGLEFIASEYLVSDEEHYATKIDGVYWSEEKQGYILVDYKTTSKLNETAVRWQLSIERYLWSLHNDLPIVGIAVSWIPNQSKYDDEGFWKELEPYTMDEVNFLLASDLAGEKALVMYGESLPGVTRNLMVEINELIVQERIVAERKKSLTENLQKLMEAHGIKKFDNDLFSATYIPESESKTFDSSAFKKECPDMFAKFQKTSRRKASIRIILKQQ